MLRKAKYLIIGLLIGILLTASAAAAFGAPAIKVYLDGNELPNARGLSIDGSVYVPLRIVSEALGLDVAWDSAARTVLLAQQENTANTKPTTSMDPDIIELSEPIKEVEDVGTAEAIYEDIEGVIPGYKRALILNDLKRRGIETTIFNGLDAIIVNGETYFNAYEYENKIYHDINPRNGIEWSNESRQAIIHLNGEDYIIPNDAIITIGIYAYIKSEYYREN